jgi:hypothetical protein
MNEIKNTTKAKINSLHVIQFPSGKFGYVGQVPVTIGYIEAGLKFGGRFGPKTRTFETKDEAIIFATEKGFEVTK